jgi:DNA-binding response OmpR family regulator
LGRVNRKGLLIIATILSAIVIDGASSDRTAVLDALTDRGFRCEAVSSPSKAAPYLAKTDFDAVVVYERSAADSLFDFVATARVELPSTVIVVVQTEYDGLMECRLFDMGADYVITTEYAPPNLAARAAMGVARRRMRESGEP